MKITTFWRALLPYEPRVPCNFSSWTHVLHSCCRTHILYCNFLSWTHVLRYYYRTHVLYSQGFTLLVIPSFGILNTLRPNHFLKRPMFWSTASTSSNWPFMKSPPVDILCGRIPIIIKIKELFLLLVGFWPLCKNPS